MRYVFICIFTLLFIFFQKYLSVSTFVDVQRWNGLRGAWNSLLFRAVLLCLKHRTWRNRTHAGELGCEHWTNISLNISFICTNSTRLLFMGRLYVDYDLLLNYSVWVESIFIELLNGCLAEGSFPAVMEARKVSSSSLKIPWCGRWNPGPEPASPGEALTTKRSTAKFTGSWNRKQK